MIFLLKLSMDLNL